jgi:hypothetical protein
MSATATDLHTADAQPHPTRAETNAANAQHSTGPTSQIGKDRVKFNALKTGLFARTVVLPHEDLDAYEYIGAYLTEQWQPRTHRERELLVTIQSATWRRDRAVNLESGLFALGARKHLEEIGEKFSDHTTSVQYSLAEAAAYSTNVRVFDQLWRQEGRLNRMIDRAERELKALIAERPLQPEPAGEAAPQPTEQPTGQPAPKPANPPTGFVPSAFPKNMPKFSGPQAKEHRRQWLRKHSPSNIA